MDDRSERMLALYIIPTKMIDRSISEILLRMYLRIYLSLDSMFLCIEAK